MMLSRCEEMINELLLGHIRDAHSYTNSLQTTLDPSHTLLVVSGCGLRAHFGYNVLHFN